MTTARAQRVIAQQELPMGHAPAVEIVSAARPGVQSQGPREEESVERTTASALPRWLVYVTERVDCEAGSAHEAQQIIARQRGVSEEYCLAVPAPSGGTDLCSRIVDGLAEANARAERDLQNLRSLHAEIEGCSMDELDERLAARKAAEDAERVARRTPRQRAKVAHERAEVPSCTGSSAGPATEAGRTEGPAQSSSPAPCAPPTRRLTERQRELLALVRVENNRAVFASDEIIPDWPALKVVLETLGGKWTKGGKKRQGGFDFADDVDAAEALRLALDTGEILDLDAAGFFETPIALADHLVALAGIDGGSVVLEPSAGRGRIASAVRAVAPRAAISCVELLPENAAALRLLGFEVIEGDFLSVATDAFQRTFTRAVMNPPFGKRADIHHIRHALQHLEPGGRLVSIASAGVKYRDDALGRAFRAELEVHGAVIEDNPDGSFLESGTGVRTVTISLTKRGAP